MKYTTLTLALTGASLLPSTLAWANMGTLQSEILSRAAASKPPAGQKDTTPVELIGDLSQPNLSPTGQSVKAILEGSQPAQSSAGYTSRVPAKGSKQCAQDTCCIWTYVAQDMLRAFKGDSGRCTALARGAIRLGFHDAAGWSKNTGKTGGADGSIVLAPEEMQRPANRGLEEIVAQTKVWYQQYKQYGVSMADLIQFSANAATVICPLGPRVRTFVGRPDSNQPCTDGLLPNAVGPGSDADTLIQLFEDKTIDAAGLAALIGAHTTSQQRFVDPKKAGDPQDSTPGVWDVLYYKQILGFAPPRVFKFQSDINLAKDGRTGGLFKAFAGNGGQQFWNDEYAKYYVRLSLLGVFNINQLAECTKALPQPQQGGGYRASDQGLVDQWVNTTADSSDSKQVGNELRDGKTVFNLQSIIDGLWRKSKSSKFRG